MNNNDSFSFLELLETILKRWWLIVAFVFVFSVVTFLYTKLAITPLYSANGTLYITVDGSSEKVDSMVASVDYNNIISARELTKTYIQILSSKTFYEEVALQSGLKYNATSLKNMVAYSNKSDTLIIQVTVKSPVPKDSAMLVETILNCSHQEISRVVSGGSVKIIDHPTVPTARSYPVVQKNLFLAIILALVLGSIISLLIEFFDDSIKGLEEFSEKYSIPILGAIPCITESSSNKRSYYYYSSYGYKRHRSSKEKEQAKSKENKK